MSEKGEIKVNWLENGKQLIKLTKGGASIKLLLNVLQSGSLSSVC